MAKGTYLMLLPKEQVRMATRIFWMEDLIRWFKVEPDMGVEDERKRAEKQAKEAYDNFVSFCAGLHMECAISPIHWGDVIDAQDVRDWEDRRLDVEDRRHKYAQAAGARKYKKATPEEIDRALKVLGLDCEESEPVIGAKKKDHIHYMAKVAGPRTREFFNDCFTALDANIQPNRWQRVLKERSLVRYFAHLDNPEKEQYNALQVLGLCGYDVSCVLDNTEKDKFDTLVACMQLIQDKNIKYYHRLVDYAFSTGDYDTINYVTGKSSMFSSYFRGMTDERREQRDIEKHHKEMEKLLDSIDYHIQEMGKEH